MTNVADDQKRVLELLSQGKITVDEANQLLNSLAGSAESGASTTERNAATSRDPQWMRITIDKTPRDGRPSKQFTIRVPLAFAKSGMRFGAMLPHLAGPRVHERLREEGLDFDWSTLDFSKYEALFNDLRETTIDIDHGRGQLRISYE